MNKYLSALSNGVIKENPTFVLLLGMCPTLATTTSALNGLSMGLATTFVLILSNTLISCLKSLIPDAVRIPAFIVVIASVVTILQLLIKAFLPSLDSSLGIFIPLIVVNCIVLGRAEAVASKSNPLIAMFDGIGIGLGFTMALTLLASVREFWVAERSLGQSSSPKCTARWYSFWRPELSSCWERLSPCSISSLNASKSYAISTSFYIGSICQ